MWALKTTSQLKVHGRRYTGSYTSTFRSYLPQRQKTLLVEYKQKNKVGEYIIFINFHVQKSKEVTMLYVQYL